MVENGLLREVVAQNVERSHRVGAAPGQSNFFLSVVEKDSLLSNQFKFS